MSSTHKSFLEKTMPLAPRPAEQILNRLVTPQARRRFGKSFNEAELLLPSMKITLIKPDASRQLPLPAHQPSLNLIKTPEDDEDENLQSTIKKEAKDEALLLPFIGARLVATGE